MTRDSILPRALWVALATISWLQPLSGQNLITNGGLEGPYTSGVASGWTKFLLDTRAVSAFEESSSVVRSGTRAQKVTLTRKLGGFFPGTILSTPINATGSPAGIVQGRDYEARVWVRSDRRELQDVALAIDSADLWQPSTYAFVRSPVGQGWKEIVLRFRAVQSDSSANLAVRLAQEGSLWVDDASVREIPAGEAAPAAGPGNLLANGSFEVGVAGWRSFYSTMTTTNLAAPSSTDLATIGSWGAGRAAHGTTALTFTKAGIDGARLESWPIAFAWKQPHTFSVCLRANSTNTTVSFAVAHRDYDYSPDANTPANALAIAASSVVVGTNWVRHQFTFTPPPVPDGQLYLVMNLPSGGTVTLDAAMLEPSVSASGAFVPKADIEAGIVPGITTTGVVASGESYAGTLRIFNAAAQAANLNLRRQARDVWGAILPASAANWTQAVPAGSAVSVPLSVNPGNATGTCRVEVDLDGNPPTALADDIFSVLPPAPSAGQNAPLGTHIDYVSPDRGFMRAGGVGWTKTWYLTWGNLEPPTASGVAKPADSSATATFTTSQVTGADNFLTGWKNSGLNVLAILGNAPAHRQKRPTNGGIAWKGYPPLNEAALADYVTKVATQFGSKVDVWELENEPDHFLAGADGLTAVESYAKMALIMVKALRAVRPGARVLLGSATTDHKPVDWIIGTFNAQPELRDLVDGVSYHNYDSDPNSTRTILGEIRTALDDADLSRLEIWDTEWAPTSNAGTFSRSAPAALGGVRPSSAVVSAALAIQGHVTRLGEGAANSFLYHAYGPQSLNDAGFNMTRELNDVALPLYAAQAVAARQLHGVTQPRRVSASGIEAYRFLRPDGRPIYVLWADGLQAGPTVNFTAPVAVSATDMMGNVYGAGEFSAGAAVPVPPEPIYLLGPATDLQVSGQGLVIDHNDTTPSAADGTDFGPAEVGFPGGGVTRVFTLRNLGSSTITFTGSPRLQLSGAHAADFVVLLEPPASLAPGATAQIEVAFRPQLGGVRSASLTLPNSAGNFSMSIAGTGTGALPALGPVAGSLSVSVRSGEVLDATQILLSNLARGELTWSAALLSRYTAVSNRQGEADAPVYDWQNIRATGQIVQFPFHTQSQDRDDVTSDPVQIGFAFPFYGTSYTSLRISSNGVVTFDGTAFIPYANTTLPSLLAPVKSIFVLWDDLYLLGTTSQVYTFQPDADTFVVSWLDVAYFSDRGARQSFQLILKRDGTILTQYATVARSPNANGFVIGLQNANTSADEALLFSRTPVPPDNSLAVRFRPPATAITTSANFTPGKPASWASFTGPSSGSLSLDESFVLPLHFNPENLVVGQTYRSTLTLTTSDPARPTLSIPLALTVLPMADPEPPVVALTAPAAGSRPELGGTLHLAASASVVRSTISRVEFYANGTLLGQALAAPFTFSWRADTTGDYSMTARAFAANGLATTSEPVNITWVRPSVPLGNLVAHWRFDEGAGTTAADFSGNNRSATLGGTASWSGSGRFSSALLLNGATNDRAAFSMPSATAYTYSAWIRLDAEGGVSGGRFPRVIETPAGAVILRRDANAPSTYGAIGFFGVRSGGSNGEWNTAAGLVALNTWYHLAVSYDATTTTNIPAIYLNGVRRNLSTVFNPGGNAVQTTGPAWIGNRSDGLRPFAGRIDHVRLYSRALTEAEVAALYLEDGAASPPTALQAWRQAHFGTMVASGPAADRADPDGDGLPNLLEYALGQPPTLPVDPAFPPVAGERAGNRLRLRFQRLADPALRYAVEAFADLSTPQTIWFSEGTNNLAGPVTVEDTVDAGPLHPCRFLRLKVAAP